MTEVDELFDEISEGGPDQSFSQYHESTKYSAEVKQQATRFVEGFHAADPDRVGIHWLVKATKAEESIDGDTSFRMQDGYSTVGRCSDEWNAWQSPSPHSAEHASHGGAMATRRGGCGDVSG